MGAPGSGKGTISERIVKRFNFKYAATGDLLRQNVKMKTPLGIEASKYMQAGQLVPDDLILKCILNRVSAIGNDRYTLFFVYRISHIIQVAHTFCYCFSFNAFFVI